MNQNCRQGHDSRDTHARGGGSGNAHLRMYPSARRSLVGGHVIFAFCATVVTISCQGSGTPAVKIASANTDCAKPDVFERLCAGLT